MGDTRVGTSVTLRCAGHGVTPSLGTPAIGRGLVVGRARGIARLDAVGGRHLARWHSEAQPNAASGEHPNFGHEKPPDPATVLKAHNLLFGPLVSRRSIGEVPMYHGDYIATDLDRLLGLLAVLSRE